MVTNLFYYNHYRPYILKENNYKRIEVSSSRNLLSEKDGVQGASYFLNKALKADVKTYISKVSTGFNYLKNTTNYLALKLNYQFDISKNVESSINKLYNFAEKYNQFLDFYNNDFTAKSNFESYINSIQNILYEKKDVLNEVGLNITPEKELEIKSEFGNELLQSCSSSTLDQLKSTCNEIYKMTCETMKEPLTSYMNFKDFSCYVNYSIYNNSDKTFGLLDGGIIINMEV